MDETTPKPTALSPAAPTLDCRPRQAPGGEPSEGLSAENGCCGQVALVEGSGPQLTRETQDLLRRRLRLAAVVMFFACLVFLPQHFFRADFSRPGSVFVFTLHCVVASVLGVLGGLICRRCQISMLRLRTAEVVMFGLCAVFLAALQHYVILGQCRELVRFKEVASYEQTRSSLSTGTWLLLVFTYALFVPNTWRRAAVVIGALAAAPIVMILAMMWAHEEVRDVLGLGDVTEFTLIMTVAAVTGLFGVDTIGSLRRQAFEARQFGQYRLTRRIGAGGMGEVYLAEHQLMKRPCVVKLIRPDKAGDAKVLARFQREVRATAKLSHWNTIEIFDYGNTEDGTFYYVMEYLPGMSLRELVERFGPMPAARVIHVLRQACDALGEAHAAGLVHRDVKPGNIFAARRGGVYDVVKLLDFGLVKPLTDEQPIQLTTDGSITGSPLFMSPEQATGDEQPDARSDIYSLGAVGYYLLTARPPFEGHKPIKVMIAVAHDKVVPPSRHREGIPADLEQVILRCLAKAPADRFQDAASLAQALADCQAADGWSRQRAAEWWQQQQETTAQSGGGNSALADSPGDGVLDRTETPYNGS
jgi:serine/threonine-protein kinase